MFQHRKQYRQKTPRSNSRMGKALMPVSMPVSSRETLACHHELAGLWSPGRLLQAKFRPVFSDVLLDVYPLDSSEGFAVQKLPPQDYFLHEPEGGLPAGEELIGLPRGLFKARGSFKDAPCPPEFFEMLDWLYSLWANVRPVLLSDQERRLRLMADLYSQGINKEAVNSSFPVEVYLEGLSQVFIDSPAFIRLYWQGESKMSFFGRDFLRHTDVEKAREETFLFIKNHQKKAGPSMERYVYRIYLNSSPNYFFHLLKFMFDRVLMEQAFPRTHLCKITSYSELNRRRDNLIIFVDTLSDSYSILSLLKDYQQAYSHYFDDDVPLMTEKKMRGVGFGQSPLRSYEPVRETDFFDYDSSLLDAFLKSITSSEDSKVQQFAVSEDASEILEKMARFRQPSFVPEGRTRAIRREEMEWLDYAYAQYTGLSSQELRALEESASETLRLGTFLFDGKKSSFQAIRTKLVAQALLDTILETSDPNVFICRVWDYFRQAFIEFFKPYKNTI